MLSRTSAPTLTSNKSTCLNSQSSNNFKRKDKPVGESNSTSMHATQAMLLIRPRSGTKNKMVIIYVDSTTSTDLLSLNYGSSPPVLPTRKQTMLVKVEALFGLITSLQREI